jgi:branched-chain amino acid transport system permease protein
LVIAGVLFVPISTLYIEMGGKVMIKGFAACILGGFGNLPGALLGGILMGIIETLFGGYVTTAMMDISSMIVIALVLIIKPQGLFGSRVVIKV